MNNRENVNHFVFKLFEDIQRNKLDYIYRGLFTQSITDNILMLTEACMNGADEDAKIKKRVFTILVEGLQNVTRHQEMDGEIATSDQSGIFIIQNQGTHYYITTGNPILKTGIPALTRQLDKINSLSPDDLKIFYKEVLNDNIISNKGGAGLGLIEMARKSGNKLDYGFSDINSNYSYFYMGTKVMLHDDAANDNTANPIEAIKEIHRTVNEQNIALIYNGIHSQDSLLYIMSIMEEHLGHIDTRLRKRMIYIIIEMLQNIVKHGIHTGDTESATKGVFFISNMGNSYQFNTVNYIPDNKVESTKQNIEAINNMSDEELSDLYDSNIIDDGSGDTRGQKGLGLAEIRLRTKNKITCITSKCDDDKSAIFLQATITQ